MDIARIQSALVEQRWGQWECTSVSDTGLRVFAMLIRGTTGEYMDVTIESDAPEYLAGLIASIESRLAAMDEVTA